MKRGVAKKRASSKGRKASKDWTSLSWDDLDRWAGGRSVSRGRSYQRQGRVHDLAISEDGRLLATVHKRELVPAGPHKLSRVARHSAPGTTTAPAPRVPWGRESR